MVTPDFSTQVHDYNPGISSTGVFWTVPIPASSAQVTLEEQMVVMDIQDFALMDTGNVPNALMGMPGVPGTVSVHVEWRRAPGTGHTVLVSEEDRFIAQLLTATVSARVTASTPSMGFSYTSMGDVETHYAVYGHESNGAFFSGSRQ